jgi:single-strand DNA-binding protein
MYQKITIAGNLGRDPEMRYMPDGTAMTSFSVAVADGWGENKKTMWFRVTVWGKRAETANQYLAKGQKVLIEGRLQGDANTGGPRLWTRQDGTVASSFELRADNFVFLSSRGEQSGGYDDGGSGGGSDFGTPAVEEDDIPF